jgi:hypothetical protein
MKDYGTLALVTCGVMALLGTSGCEVAACKNDQGENAICAKSLTRFEGDAIEPDAIAYTPGTDVTVHGKYGDIRVVEGAAGEVRVKLEPFDYRAHDAEAAARAEIADHLDYSFAENDLGISAETDRHDSTNGLGADITLFLPPEFDGKLELGNESDGPVNPGDIEAEFVGAATSLILATGSLGDCIVNGAPSVGYTRAHCDGEIVLTDVSNGGMISTTGLEGSIRLELAGITDGGGGGTISTEDGDITVKFPSEASFSLVALAHDEGTVTGTSLEQVCEQKLGLESTKEYICGDAVSGGPPHYTISAGGNGVGPSNVLLTF